MYPLALQRSPPLGAVLITRHCRWLLARDACGLLASLAVMCEGAIEDKVDVVFNVFDFNNAGAMTKEELVRYDPVLATVLSAGV